jgi:hypothetical protein
VPFACAPSIGENVTGTTQLAPLISTDPQGFPDEKYPEAEIEVIETGDTPVFLMVTYSVELLPTGILPKSKMALGIP